MTNLNNWPSKHHKKPSTMGGLLCYYLCLVFDHRYEIIKQVT